MFPIGLSASCMVSYIFLFLRKPVIDDSSCYRVTTVQKNASVLEMIPGLRYSVSECCVQNEGTVFHEMVPDQYVPRSLVSPGIYACYAHLCTCYAHNCA